MQEKAEKLYHQLNFSHDKTRINNLIQLKHPFETVFTIGILDQRYHQMSRILHKLIRMKKVESSKLSEFVVFMIIPRVAIDIVRV